MAGAYVVLEQDVLAHHLRAIGSFNPTLYRVFADRAERSGVFNDIVHGTTDLLQLGCCKARRGYDEASGLGSVNFDRLASALIKHPSLEVPWTTIDLAASVPAPGIDAAITVTTNNDLAGTPNVINVFAGGASVGHCAAQPVSPRLQRDPPPGDGDDLRRRRTAGRVAGVEPRALASTSRKVTLKFTRPPCQPLRIFPGAGDLGDLPVTPVCDLAQ